MFLTRSKRVLSFILCAVLIAATALFATGCSDNKTDDSKSSTVSVVSTPASSEVSTDDNVLGEGDTEFTFTVTDKDGNQTEFVINTDKEMVGEALLEHGLIAGDDSEYGLYVKTVNGITANYDVDRIYWAFYIDGEYAMTGVDSTPVTDGANYEFKVEQG